jgi:hypothetical protein
MNEWEVFDETDRHTPWAGSKQCCRSCRHNVSGTQSALGKLPSTFSDPSAEEGAKSAGLPSTNLFTVRTTTAEKMQAMSNVSLLNERISQIQDHSSGLKLISIKANCHRKNVKCLSAPWPPAKVAN